jgi:hypothetical protein
MRRIEGLAKRLAKLEAAKGIDERLYPMPFGHGDTIFVSGADITLMLRSIDGKTRGIPSQQSK